MYIFKFSISLIFFVVLRKDFNADLPNNITTFAWQVHYP